MKNLKSEEERKEAAKQLHLALFSELTKLGFYHDLRGRISEHCVEIGLPNEKNYDNLYYEALGSSITLYPYRESILGVQKREINFGTAGSFDLSDKLSVWRTKHSALVIDKWDEVFTIIERYSRQYDELIEKIKQANSIC